jgi:ASTRA-associated protein 1
MFSTHLPVEDQESVRQKPWLLHSLSVNTLNFCSFAMASDPVPSDSASVSNTAGKYSASATIAETHDNPANNGILIAVPGTNDNEINVFHLPSENRRYIIPQVSAPETGMCNRYPAAPRLLQTTHLFQ